MERQGLLVPSGAMELHFTTTSDSAGGRLQATVSHVLANCGTACGQFAPASAAAAQAATVTLLLAAAVAVVGGAFSAFD